MSALPLATLTGADLFGLIVSAAGLRLPGLRAAARGEALMAQGWLQIAVFVAVLVALIKPVGIYMARVFTNQRVFLSPVVGPIERLTYRALRVRPDEGQDWKGYARSLIVFSLLFWVALYLILRTQGIQPVQPARASTPAPGTSASTPPPPSSPTPTGSTTAAKRRSPTSPRWRG